MRFKNSMSLVEVLIILVIIGILAGFAYPGFRNSRLKARDREAQTQLMQMQDAQRMRRLQTGTYVSCADTLACETALGLDFPPLRPTGYWDYSVPTADAVAFCAQVDHDGERAWHIEQGDDEAQKGDCNGQGGGF